MIVKDESHILGKTLENLTNVFTFDYWVICDTGSSDNTRDIIHEHFSKKNIKGELHDDPWKDFGTNRSRALELAYKKTDYVLMFDADDAITGSIVLPKTMTADLYGFLFSNEVCSSSFHRYVLFNNQKRWKYVGVLHEYAECMEPTTGRALIMGDYKCYGRTMGNRSKDPQKYQKDAEVLKAAYEEATLKNDPIRNRYAFYCANSYKDSCMYKEALEWYKKVLTLDNWTQEKYVSCLRIYEMYGALQTPEHGMYALTESLRYDKERLECIHTLVAYYLGKGMCDIAYKYYECIQDAYETKFPQPSFAEKLFVNHEIPKFLFPYNMIVLADRVKQHKTAVAMYRIIFQNKHVPKNHWYLGHFFNNLTYSVAHIPSESLQEFAQELQAYVQLCKEATYVLTAEQETTVKEICERSKQNVDTVVVAILAKDKAYCLQFYLQCLLNQTFPKQQIHLYIRTNDNKDDTIPILSKFVSEHGKKYASVHFDSSSISPTLQTFKEHEWNVERFSILGQIRMESVKYAKAKNAHYFVADVDNFLVPSVLETLVNEKTCGVIAPMLECHRKLVLSMYSNFHYDVDENGYYKDSELYNQIHGRTIKGIVEVAVVHCTYFIRNNVLKAVNYDDGTGRHEYVIFSDSLRKKGVSQYLDNRKWYGFLTLSDSPDDYQATLASWKDSMKCFGLAL